MEINREIKNSNITHSLLLFIVMKTHHILFFNLLLVPKCHSQVYFSGKCDLRYIIFVWSKIISPNQKVSLICVSFRFKYTVNLIIRSGTKWDKCGAQKNLSDFAENQKFGSGYLKNG